MPEFEDVSMPNFDFGDGAGYDFGYASCNPSEPTMTCMERIEWMAGNFLF